MPTYILLSPLECDQKLYGNFQNTEHLTYTPLYFQIIEVQHLLTGLLLTEKQKQVLLPFLSTKKLIPGTLFCKKKPK